MGTFSICCTHTEGGDLLDVHAPPHVASPPEIGSPLYERLRVRAPDIMDTEQDAYARRRGYRNIDEILDDPRRA